MAPNVRPAANTASRPKFVLWNAVALLAGLIPVAIYWAAVGRVPGVGVAEARAELARDPSSVLLLDVRPAARSAAKPIPGAVNVPWPELRGMTTAAELPEGVAGKRVLVICDSGIKAAPAVRRLRALGLTGARRVSGGMEAWQAYGDGRTSAAPRRPMSLFEQWLAVIVAFGVKPVYMLLRSRITVL